jgi:hypothetical protein
MGIAGVIIFLFGDTNNHLRDELFRMGVAGGNTLKR